jgi:zinc transport system substrate-binding protein
MCSPDGADLRQTTSSFASLHIFLALLLVSVFSACSQTPQPEQTDDNRLVVVVDNYPLLYMTQRLTDDAVNAKLLAPEDIDPAMWNPSPEKLAEIQKADLVFTNGAGYSGWLSRVSLDEDKIVNTSAAIEADYIEIEDAVTHQHGPGGEHTHSGTAFTTWLDFSVGRQQARATANALLELLPTEMKKERAKVEKEIVKLESDFFSFDGRMKSLVSAAKQPKMIGSHPVYQYLARRYLIPMESVHWEPEETPDSKQWQEFDALREKHAADIMLWEAEPTAETRKQLESRGVKVVVFDPAANVPATGDFIEIMDANISRLEAATGAPPWPPN